MTISSSAILLVRLIFLVAGSLSLLESNNNRLLVINGFCLTNKNLQASHRHQSQYLVSTKSGFLLLAQQQESSDDDATNNLNNQEFWNNHPDNDEPTKMVINGGIGMINKIATSSSKVKDDLWLERLHSLEKFKQKNGHCRVPQSYDVNPSLGLWVCYQRMLKKRGSLSEERSRMLNELGFEWKGKRRENMKLWLQKFEKLEVYKEKNGHCLVPAAYEEDPLLGTWVQNQRQFKKKGRLSEERERMLNDLGFEWSKRKIKPWLEQFCALEKFKRENGHCCVPLKYYVAPSLRVWVYTQRQCKEKGRLSKEQEDMLRELGLEWSNKKGKNPNRKLWLQKFRSLEKFKQENGHCRIPKRYIVDGSLGFWVGTQRQLKKKGVLLEERERMLNELGFEWNVDKGRNANTELWLQRFHSLQKFKQQYEHIKMDEVDSSLKTWVQNQRQFKKKGSLPEGRERLLNEIGFEWTKLWFQQFNALKTFKQKNGHCRVPATYEEDPSLGTWVQNQRQLKKKGCLTEKREQMLNAIGFEWAKLWLQHFNALKEFKQNNGHCRVPSTCEEDPSLGTWVQNQRQFKKKGRLSDEREQMLNELDFEWNISKPWVEHFHILEKFKQENGHLCVPLKCTMDPSLGMWVANQRQLRKTGRLLEERERMLNELGFE